MGISKILCFGAFFLGQFVVASHAQNVKNESTYEYIIVGSGPGGGTLSANLARQGHSVLLLEAGEDHGDSPLQVIPSFSTWASENDTMSWEFFVQHYEDPEQAYKDDKYVWKTSNGSLYVGLDPPAHAQPLGIYYPRVGTLGGCGNHNAMNLAMPPDQTWEDIANITSDQTWNAASMRRYFENIEKCNYLPEGSPGHGFAGWLGSNQNDLAYLDDGTLRVLQSGMNILGQANVSSTSEIQELVQLDLNRLDEKRYQEQSMFLLPLHADGERHRSSAQTYLRDTVSARAANGSHKYPLTISTSSLATKVLFREDTVQAPNVKPKAIGVNYLRGQGLYKADRRYNSSQEGVSLTAYASREVIVAGGAFNTPQILKLSGIGPKEELERFNIPVVVDLPAVGTNLQDNYEVGVESLASVDFVNFFENCTFLEPNDPCLAQFEHNHTGPYGTGAAPVGMLARSTVSENEDTDLFFFGGAGSIFRGYFPGFSRATAPLSTFWWSIVKMQVQNRAGTVSLRSADPRDVPQISFNYFSQGADHDLQALQEGVNLARGIFNQTEAPYSPFINSVPPINDTVGGIKDEAWGHHASCSCPIGAEGDERACVDSKFRVQGVDGLRVVDGSVFPRVPGGFPILPTFLISEKATDDILST